MMLRCTFTALLTAAALLAQGSEFDELLARAQQQLRAGRWSAAREAFAELQQAAVEEPAGQRPEPAVLLAAQLGEWELDLGQGAYEGVVAHLRALPAAAQADAASQRLLGLAYERVGNYASARTALQASVAACAKLGADASEARLLLGEVERSDGQRQQAARCFQELAADQTANATYRARALLYLGQREHLEQASQLLQQALAGKEPLALARITLGEVKFAAYSEAAGFPSGERDLKQALDEHGDVEAALLAMYRLRSSNMVLDFERTEEFLARALDHNPRCVEALVIRAVHALDDRRFLEAAERLDAALEINPNHKLALTHRAAAAYLLADAGAYERFRARALLGDAGWPEVDCALGEHLAAVYRFGDAVTFFRAALASDSSHVPSLHGLARSLVYVGEGGQAKATLQKAKELQPGFVNPWRNNVLSAQALLETDYQTTKVQGFSVQLHRDDQQVLATYLLPVLVLAKEELGQKYGYQPEQDVVVESLHTWDDFSVRTTGFRGFTALGACFGKLITLVSPRDRDVRRQDFMWEATAWHEYAHVLTLGLSHHRVPRWLTEGFSVYEERQRDATWERGMDRELLNAYHNQDIPSVRLLNRLFRGPRILFGYYQGGLLVELIANKYGFGKALALLTAYGEDLELEAAFQKALGVSSRQIDEELLAFIHREKLRGMVVVPQYNDASVQRLLAQAQQDRKNLAARVQLAWACVQRENPVDAGRWLAEVLRAEPAHAGAWLVRASLLRQRGELDGALAAWGKGFVGADDFDSRIACGDVLAKREQWDDAIAMYEAAKACWPGCTETSSAPELRLAGLYRDRGERELAQREMQAYCRRSARAFTPRYSLAEFAREAGDFQAQLRYLVECNRIDPFLRELHVRMASAYQQLQQPALAARELEVAAAVLPELERNRSREPVDPAAEREAKAQLWLQAAHLRDSLGDRTAAAALVERILAVGAEANTLQAARELQEQWRAK